MKTRIWKVAIGLLPFMLLPVAAVADDATFTGTVEALPVAQAGQAKTLTGQWTVSGKKVNVSGKTEIDQDKGPVDVGSCVEVSGAPLTAGAPIEATSIDVRRGQGGCKDTPGQNGEDVNFRGTVSSIVKDATGGTSTWMVGGHKVSVTSNTKIEPQGNNAPAVNDCVSVEGSQTATLIVVASRIQRLGSGVCQNGEGQNDSPRLIGLIEKLPPPPTGTQPATLVGSWTVNGQAVTVSASTRLDDDEAPFAVGACVQVRGPIQNQVLMATMIQTLEKSDCATVKTAAEYEMYGTVGSIPASLPGIYVINSRNVAAATSTVIDTTNGKLVVGACVSVHGTLQSDGVSVLATSITVVSTNGACILPHGVVSSGSFSSFAVSPGQIVSIFGLNIGPATEVPLVVLPNNTISSKLANYSVTFDGVAAPILYLGLGQINAVVPCTAKPGTTLKIQIQSNGAWSNTVTVPVVAAWPSIFTLQSSGKGPGAILNVSADGKTVTVNGVNNPAPAGSSVQVYATGLGTTSVGCLDAQIIQPNNTGVYPTVTGVTATIGGKDAKVTYAGSAPGNPSGLFQVNVIIPDGVSGSTLPIQLKVTAGGTTVTSPIGVTIAVK